MKYFDWEDVWQGAVLVLGLALAVLLVVMLAAPKNVDYYYMSRGSESAPGICVQAHWTWHVDETAFCSDDYSRALDFMQKANAGMKK